MILPVKPYYITAQHDESSQSVVVSATEILTDESDFIYCSSSKFYNAYLLIKQFKAQNREFHLPESAINWLSGVIKHCGLYQDGVPFAPTWYLAVGKYSDYTLFYPYPAFDRAIYDKFDGQLQKDEGFWTVPLEEYRFAINDPLFWMDSLIVNTSAVYHDPTTWCTTYDFEYVCKLARELGEQMGPASSCTVKLRK